MGAGKENTMQNTMLPAQGGGRDREQPTVEHHCSRDTPAAENPPHFTGPQQVGR